MFMSSGIVMMMGIWLHVISVKCGSILTVWTSTVTIFLMHIFVTFVIQGK